MAPPGLGARGGGGGGSGRSGGIAGMEHVAALETEEDKLKQPCFEGYLNGFWWEVEILQRRSLSAGTEKFLVRYIGLEDEEDEWVSLDSLRLRARRTDDWDCGILRRGVDVAVSGVHHPQAEQLRPPTTMALYDARIVSVTKSKHQLDCCCKFFIQFYDIKGGTSLVDGVDRALFNHPAKEVQISKLSVLQQPGSIALHEILKAHISTKAEDQRWSVDAYFLKETELRLVGIKGEEESMTTPRGAFNPDVSEEGLANPGGKPRTVQGQHFGISKSHKFPDVETTARHGTGWPDTVQKHVKREVNEVDQRGMKSPQRNNLKYSDRGLKRKNESVEEKEISNIEDYSPGVSSPFARSKDMAAGGSRWQDQNVGQRLTRSGHETLHKVEEAVDLKRGRKLKMEDSESSPDENFPESSADLIVDSDHNSERGSTRDVFHKRGRREEQPGKSQRYDERRSTRYERHKASERVLKNKSRGASKQVKSPDIIWQAEDRDPGRYYNTQKVEKRSLPGKDSKLDKKPEEENSGRRRGRPRGVRNGKGYEWMEEKSPRDMKDNLGRPKHSREPEYKRSGNPDANFEPPNDVAAFGHSQEIETGREMSRREKGKLPERIVPTRSSERLQKVSPVKPMTKQKENEKGDNDPGSAKTDVYLSSSSPNSEDPASELGSQQLRKLRPRIPLKSKKSPPISGKSNKMQRDAEKEKGAKEKVIERPPPLYMDLLVNNSKEDDHNEMQRRSNEKKPNSGLKDTWCPIVEDVLSDDSDCNIVSEKEPLPRTLWQEFDETAPAVGTEQPPTLQDAAKPKVHDSDGDLDGIKCEHKLELKDDVGYACIICGIITEDIEDLVPQVEIPHRRPREADLDEWDFDRYSPDGNQGAIGYDQIKNVEVVNMLKTSLPPHYAQQMHPHQKDGFEFLWRNLGYDAEGNLRTKKADRNAGCILSHAPGTGKSFLIISFLKSYMDRFPTSQPLIVAPKIMLLRWQKEFVRWKSDIKVFILNTALTYGKRLLQKHEEAGVVSLKSHQMNSRGLVDYLRQAVLYEWKNYRSVCLVSYNLFSALTDEDGSNRTQEGEMVGKCLLESTGILILDEGHFPRNKDTRIRKALMKVKTNARILLSGTLFQNNFEELFNTLYLVRPGFVEAFSSCDLGSSSDMLRNELDEILDDDHPAMEEVTEAAERKARKLFVEEIGMKIEEGQLCKGSEVLQHGANTGLQMLQRMTANFVHHHTGEVLGCLPGLRDFGILLKPTTLQCSLLEVVEKRFQRPEEYLKREIAVSETSIHPKLLTSLDFVKSDKSSLNSLGAGPRSDLSAMLKEPSNPQDGVKTKFVFDLLRSLSTNEKVLIFSQHMAPLDMLEAMFKQTFNWDKNKDVLRLDGTMVMNDREAVIERFNDPSSQVQVLLASTKACGEGINLVGASRVVFLDVLWNPAVIKQAISRAFRLGQKKIVYVYRLIAIGTIEEKKYKKAIRKDWLSMSIFTPTAGEGDGEPDGQTEDLLVDPPEGISSKNQSRGEEIRAWEVDASTCEDGLLEKLLKKDKSETNSFMKVMEHGSQFHNRKTPCGPDAREWFLEDWDYKDLSHTTETRMGDGPGVEDPNPEVLAQKLYQDYGEIGAFDAGAASGSDTDEEIL